MVPKLSEGATKGLRVIKYIDPYVLKPNFLDYRLVIIPLQLPVTSIQQENVVVTTPGNS